MPKSEDCQFVIDCWALADLCQTTSNIIWDTVIGMIQSGKIRIPTIVWNEFCEMFEDEAADINTYEPEKIKSKPAHRAAAGTIASKANSGFRTEPYNNSDWYAGAVAQTENFTLITITSQCGFYGKLVSCPVVAITDIN